MSNLSLECEFILAELLADIITGEMSDKLRELRFSAATTLRGYLNRYKKADTDAVTGKALSLNRRKSQRRRMIIRNMDMSLLRNI